MPYTDNVRLFWIITSGKQVVLIQLFNHTFHTKLECCIHWGFTIHSSERMNTDFKSRIITWTGKLKYLTTATTPPISLCMSSLLQPMNFQISIISSHMHLICNLLCCCICTVITQLFNSFTIPTQAGIVEWCASIHINTIDTNPV